MAGIALGRCARVAVALALLGSVAGCSLDSDPNPDSRAYPGADPDVTLEVGLKDHRLALPAQAKDVRFGAFSGREYNFDLGFSLPCAGVSDFLRTSTFKKPLQPDLIPSLVETLASARGWEIDKFPDPRGIDGDLLGAANRSVLVAGSGPVCQVFTASFK